MEGPLSTGPTPSSFTNNTTLKSATINYISKKAKAISAELFELNLKVQLYNPVICMTKLALFRTNSSQNMENLDRFVYTSGLKTAP